MREGKRGSEKGREIERGNVKAARKSESASVKEGGAVSESQRETMREREREGEERGKEAVS